MRSRFRQMLATTVLLLSSGAAIAAASGATTPPLEFVREYVRELEELRSAAELEFKRKDANNQLSSAIYTSTRIKMALEADVSRLSGMHLNPPTDFVIPSIVKFYEQENQIQERLVAISTEFMSGPKPGVDYGTMAAEMPKLRAALDDINETLFKATPAVEATLLADRPDSQGHMSRLNITKADRADLIRQINCGFGTKLDQKQQSYYVSVGSVIRSWLRSGYTASDEPEKPASGNSRP